MKTTFRHVAITGAIGAGKTTLASRLAREYNAVHISSDAIRESLSRKQQPSGRRVFEVMHEQLLLALSQGASVVLDSSGMSPRFRAILHAFRAQLKHVHLLLKDPALFQQREQQRTDRSSGPLPRAAFNESRRIVFTDPPDVIVETDDLDAEQVYKKVSCAIGDGTS